ncbi:hypothetical protein AAY473_030372 [Plecturocebus cupreus]
MGSHCFPGWSRTPVLKSSSSHGFPKPGDPQAEQPHGRQRCFGRRLFGRLGCFGRRLLCRAPRGSPHKIHWSVCPLNWRVELREGGLKGD